MSPLFADGNPQSYVAMLVSLLELAFYYASVSDDSCALLGNPMSPSTVACEPCSVTPFVTLSTASTLCKIDTAYSPINYLSSIKTACRVAFTYPISQIGSISIGTLSVFSDAALFDVFGTDSMIL
ncbi:hypothetical protein L211DRAFT_854144 [Terfezia boudieri ATCC MYA-4762]|uniref:Uncharacterized protein n=1 Tax=Terfezia boudieri ATCC MYA-4762 TaxID=1051890 RepID=A0A3N4L6F1_9PEZI|nr:hypothetical protein L211DRAFT_854144 [Terfezia boudieri ATCC MYA-4762]